MRKVKVRRKALLAKLIDNRAKHEAEFLEAQEGYAEEAVGRLRRARDVALAEIQAVVKRHIERIQESDFADVDDSSIFIHSGVQVRLKRPKSHVYDYDVAIQMAEMEVEDEVELTQAEFQQFVMDDWDWKEDFAATTAIYKK